MRFTREVAEAAAIVGMPLLDHVVHIHQRIAEPVMQFSPDRGLATARHADQGDRPGHGRHGQLLVPTGLVCWTLMA